MCVDFDVVYVRRNEDLKMLNEKVSNINLKALH